ncbi:hypothetical protein AKJ09_07746 [Labilithrix luteola]|uniref:Uncharacterized protein n=1 Tax=Labilithrix luteola TaxID=1391654 RepID=A0A0K1Q5R8_9BACT|nr:hypothetical protein AKJ09_07746 [Labilithrix luteola]
MKRGARLGVLLGILGLSLVACARCSGIGGPPPNVRLSSFDAGAREAPRASEGCGRPRPASATSHDVIEAPEPNGEKRARSYELVVPADYDPRHPYPLVFAFHGSGGDGSGFGVTRSSRPCRTTASSPSTPTRSSGACGETTSLRTGGSRRTCLSSMASWHA